MNARTTFLTALTVLAAPLSAAFADELTHTGVISLENPGQGAVAEALLLPTFPAELGELQEIRVELSYTQRTGLRVENTSKQEHFTQLKLVEAFQLRAGADDPFFQEFVHKTEHVQLAGYDGDLDYAGPSGASYGHEAAEESSLVLEPGDSWTSTGGRDRVELRADYLRAQEPAGGPILASQDLGGSVRLRIKVTYVY